MATPPPRDVPCGSCTLCCRGEAVFLFPEHGDDAVDFDTVPSVNPLNGRPSFRLKQTPEGDCIYLGEHGCAIHERRPVMCRTFSCISMYVFTPRPERRRRERILPGAAALYARGRELFEGGHRP